MKLIHLSDLHLGRQEDGYSLIEDQRYILDEILQIIDKEQPDGVMIAGDVYDKSVPSERAVELFDDFLVKLSKRKTEVFVISGNHDSPERLAFAGRILDTQGIHIAPVFHGEVNPISMQDSHGIVNIYMLPFIKPIHVKRYFETEATTYTEAMQVVVEHMHLPMQDRNVLITHQFVTGSQRSDSERVSVGGSDNVDASVFEPFDYVALGHIHAPQNCGSDKIRYCGTPLKYSFSEVNHKKSVTVVTLGEKGDVSYETIPLVPRLDMMERKGSFAELMQEKPMEDYVRIILTDENDIPNALGRLRAVYKNLMSLDYDNQRTRSKREITGASNVEQKSPLEHFEMFFHQQNNQPMSDEQFDYMKQLIERIWEGEA